MSASRKEATPIELAALLMDTVCAPTPQEQDALGELAAQLQVDLGKMQIELMFLRAFAVDFAIDMALGAGLERQAIRAHYYRHWERISQETGEEVLADLQARLNFYAEALEEPGQDPTSLKGTIGRAFALCCGEGSTVQELALLGGEMFGALFDEIAELLQEVDIVLYEGEEKTDLWP